MAKGQQIDVDYVVSFCEAIADEHKLGAIREDQEAFSSVKDKRKRDAHIAKSTMADEIANHFRNPPPDRLKPSAEVDDLARQIDPETFARNEAMIRRLVADGADESYAMRVAEQTYGEALSEARDKAIQSMQTSDTMSGDTMADFASGVGAVIAWHERRALESENAAAGEHVATKKAKYASRAQRHRLYAKHILQEFQSQMAARPNVRERMRDPAQPDLPFPRHSRSAPAEEEGIPLEVQRAFMRKSEVFDDEGHAD